MALDPEQSLLFTGSSEGEMKAWRLDHESMRGGLRETDSGEVRLLISVTTWTCFTLEIGCSNHTPHHQNPTLLQPSCVSDNIPPNSTLPRRTVSRPIRGGVPREDAG